VLLYCIPQLVVFVFCTCTHRYTRPVDAVILGVMSSIRTLYFRSTCNRRGNCDPILATVYSHCILQLAVFVCCSHLRVCSRLIDAGINVELGTDAAISTHYLLHSLPHFVSQVFANVSVNSASFSLFQRPVTPVALGSDCVSVTESVFASSSSSTSAGGGGPSQSQAKLSLLQLQLLWQ
jgi:hypothetical protein